MAHYDGMREAINAGNESLRKAKRKALDAVAYRGRRMADEEVVEWLANLQDHGKSLTNRDVKMLASARAVIERLTNASNESQRKAEAVYETEIIDRLFLELSQFTAAKTKRELELEAALRHIKGFANNPTDGYRTRCTEISQAVDTALSGVRLIPYPSMEEYHED